MEPKFVNYPGETVVGMGRGFNMDTTGDIPKLWQQFVSECKQAGMATRHAFGVCMGSHPKISKGQGETFVYMAAVPKSAAAGGERPSVPPDMVTYDIAPGNYAVFTHKGTIADFPTTVKWIWSTWIPEHKELYREAADFEFYDERFDPQTSSGEVDVYIPVK